MDKTLSLETMQRIRLWHLAHKADHPVEGQLWDALLGLWLMGWVGWLPGMALDALWTWPLCALAMQLPSLYVAWRIRAHQRQHLRCDWLDRLH